MTMSPPITLARHALATAIGLLAIAGGAHTDAATMASRHTSQTIDLAAAFRAGALRPINRAVSVLAERPGAVRVSAREGPGVMWIAGTETFADGTISLDVRGRDVYQQSFPGVAFHRKDDTTYEGIYLRPFNFRATDSDRHGHALQYISVPAYDWPRLRQEHPGQFERAVPQTIAPTGWVPLRVVVARGRVQTYVGPGTTPTLDVEALGGLTQGAIGLWVGNNSDGDFAELRIAPAK